MDLEKFGLRIYPEFVCPQEEWNLIEAILCELDLFGDQEGDARGGRPRILSYGWHDAKEGRKALPIPVYLGGILRRAPGGPYDSVTINEYRSGGGIPPHIDIPEFGPSICILSLNAGATMRFTGPDGHTVDGQIVPRDLIQMTGEIRSIWKHSILGEKRPCRRYSIVLRLRL